MIPPGTLLVGKEQFAFLPNKELGVIIACLNEDHVKVWGGILLYEILHMDGSTKHVHENNVSNYYELIE